MRNLWLITRREFLGRLKSGSFIASTAIMMLAFFGATFVPFVLGGSGSAPLQVTVLDRTGQLYEPLQQVLAQMPAVEGQRTVELTRASGDEESLIDAASDGGPALLIIEGSYPDGLRARFLASSVGQLSSARLVTGPLESIVRGARMAARGLPADVALEILEPMTIEEKQLAAGEERSDEQFMGALMLALGAILSVYMITVINSQYVFQGVLEEKVSRVVEVMAAAVKPSEMMMGKVIGLGLLGVVQYLAMMVAWVLGNTLASQAISVPVGSLTPQIALLLMAFVLLSYALNSTLMAALGATISRMEDSQTVATPVLLLMMIPMFLITPIMNDPNSPLATALSFFPVWTPIVMLMRVMLGQVPPVQVWLSVGLLVATTGLVAWASGRIYRAALLTFGSRPTLKQLWQYLRAG